ncbi:MAG: hypothetical protein WC470_01780 [Candidatus Paceibacterota bacterium]
MDFRVPQFIEHDPKILGPLTMSQTLFIGAAVGACFLLYFSLGVSNFFMYIIACGVLLSVALALAFIKIEGFDLSTVGKNLANFSLNSKLYIWKRKESPVFLTMSKEKPLREKKIDEKASGLKMKQQGKMEDLIKKIDFGK